MLYILFNYRYPYFVPSHIYLFLRGGDGRDGNGSRSTLFVWQVTNSITSLVCLPRSYPQLAVCFMFLCHIQEQCLPSVSKESQLLDVCIAYESPDIPPGQLPACWAILLARCVSTRISFFTITMSVPCVRHFLGGDYLTRKCTASALSLLPQSFFTPYEYKHVRFVQNRFNLSLPGHNGCLLTDDVFSCIFVNNKFGILIRISPPLVPMVAIDNNTAMV